MQRMQASPTMRFLLGLALFTAVACNDDERPPGPGTPDGGAADAGNDAARDTQPDANADAGIDRPQVGDGAIDAGQAVDAPVDAPGGDANAASNGDGGERPDARWWQPDVGTLHAISSTACYDVVAVSVVNDGCGRGLSGSLGWQLNGAYDRQYGMWSLGRPIGSPPQPSFGTGLVTFNRGTLTRDNKMPIVDNCTLRVAVTSDVTVTGTDEFAVGVSWTESDFASTCANPPPPASGTCISTWTWRLRRGTCVVTAL